MNEARMDALALIAEWCTGMTGTCDPVIRSQVLYPNGLGVQTCDSKFVRAL